MKKNTVVIVALLVCTLFMCSCAQLAEIFSPGDKIPPDGTRPENSLQTEKYNPAYISALVQTKTANPVIGLFADDFDLDGKYEAYVLTCSELIPEGTLHSGGMSLWFVKNDKVTELIPESNLTITPEIWKFSDKKLFSIDAYVGTNVSTSVFFVSGNSAYSYGDFEGKLIRASADSNDFYLTGRGRPYYLYFDGNFFCEYAGVELRVDQLRALSGADEILSAISDGGYIIDDILFRNNGIININISSNKAGEALYRENVTLLYSDDTVHLVPRGEDNNPFINLENKEAAKQIINDDFANAEAFSYGGSYSAASLEHIAVYPEKIVE